MIYVFYVFVCLDRKLNVLQSKDTTSYIWRQFITIIYGLKDILIELQVEFFP